MKAGPGSSFEVAPAHIPRPRVASGHPPVIPFAKPREGACAPRQATGSGWGPSKAEGRWPGVTPVTGPDGPGPSYGVHGQRS